MATIFNTVERVAGEDQPRFEVEVELVWDTTVAPVAKVEADDILIHGPYYATADNDGHWAIGDLYANTVIVPADSVYKITETFTDSSSQVYYVSIPDAATPVFWVGDILIAEPEYV